jgi:hypothetical protein
MRMLSTIFSLVLSDKWKSCAWQGVTDRSQEVEVEAVCEHVPTCVENTYSAVPVTFQSHNRNFSNWKTTHVADLKIN